MLFFVDVNYSQLNFLIQLPSDIFKSLSCLIGEIPLHIFFLTMIHLHQETFHTRAIKIYEHFKNLIQNRR
jgi:hypothetical protein